MSEDIFDLIDNAIGQHGDAMRWSPDSPPPPEPDKELWSRYERYLAIVDHHESGRRLVVDGREPDLGIALTDIYREPSVVGRGMSGRLAYRRDCAGCHGRHRPIMGMVPRPVPFVFSLTATPEVLTVDRAHLCGNCMRPFPGPALWGEAQRDVSRGQIGLRLSDDGGSRWLVAYIMDDLEDYVAEAWRELERRLAWERLPTCVTPGCGEKAPTTFTVDWSSVGAAAASALADFLGAEARRFRFCGRTWEQGQRIELCPEHASFVYRGEDPARPGERREDLLSMPWTVMR